LWDFEDIIVVYEAVIGVGCCGGEVVFEAKDGGGGFETLVATKGVWKDEMKFGGEDEATDHASFLSWLLCAVKEKGEERRVVGGGRVGRTPNGNEMTSSSPNFRRCQDDVQRKLMIESEQFCTSRYFIT
jgi:hypothetical protein